MKTLKIELNQVKNIVEGDEDEKEQAESFICVNCKRFPVPDFVLGKDGIKKESVKICQCMHCSRLACYDCWKTMCAKKDPVCPNCRFRVDDIPKDLHKEEDAEKKVEKYLNILNQKLLLKMLFKQIIFHACPMELKDALIKATNLYTKNIREVKIKVLAEKRAN